MALVLLILSFSAIVFGQTIASNCTAPGWSNPLPSNLTLGNCQGYFPQTVPSGASCNVTCAQGYNQTGDGLTTCRNGNWSDPNITCVQSSGTNGTNQTKYVTLNTAGANCTQTPSIIYICNQTLGLICQNGVCASQSPNNGTNQTNQTKYVTQNNPGDNCTQSSSNLTTIYYICNQTAGLICQSGFCATTNNNNGTNGTNNATYNATQNNVGDPCDITKVVNGTNLLYVCNETRMLVCINASCAQQNPNNGNGTNGTNPNNGTNTTTTIVYQNNVGDQCVQDPIVNVVNYLCNGTAGLFCNVGVCANNSGTNNSGTNNTNGTTNQTTYVYQNNAGDKCVQDPLVGVVNYLCNGTAGLFCNVGVCAYINNNNTNSTTPPTNNTNNTNPTNGTSGSNQTVTYQNVSQPCNTDQLNGANPPLVILKCNDGLECLNSICVDPKTLPPTVITVQANQSCTPGSLPNASNFVANCIQGYQCDSRMLICVPIPSNTNGTSNVTVTTNTSTPGAKCGPDTNVICVGGLFCNSTILQCQIPNLPPTPATISGVGGVCGGTSNCKCDPAQNLICFIPTGLNTTTVQGTCQSPPPAPTTCADGTTQIANTSTGGYVCVPCAMGTYSTGGAPCKNCEAGTYTPNSSATRCSPCPTDATVAVQTCKPVATCPNCNLNTSSCIYNNSGSSASTATCVPKVCSAACPTGSQCYYGSCTVLQISSDPTVAAVQTSSAPTLANAGIDPSTFNNASTTVPANGSVTVPTTINSSTAVPSISSTAPVVCNGTSLSSNDVVLGSKGSIVATNGSSVSVGTITVVSSAGAPTTAILNSQASNGQASPTYTIGNLTLTSGTSCVLSGNGTYNLGATSNAPGSGITVAGASLTGTISTPITITSPDGINPPTMTCPSTLTLTAPIYGQPGVSLVTVTAGGNLITSQPIMADLSIAGNATLNGTLVNGTVTVSGVLKSVGLDTPPHLDIFAACGGVIYFYVNGSTGSGQIFTSNQVDLTKFTCEIIAVQANGWTKRLTVQVGSTTNPTRRRLLSTSTSNCNTATVTNSGGTFNLCSQQSSATHLRLSSFVVFVALFITLFFQF